jgi:hypothetical protein
VSLEPESLTPDSQRFNDAEGVFPPGDAAGRAGFLSDAIIDLGFAPREVVDAAVEESRQIGQTPEQILIESQAITADQLAMAIAERNGLAYVDLFQFNVDTDAARLIDSDTARRYRALPISFDIDGALVVAVVDPMDALAVSDIGVITKSEVRTAVTSDPGMDALLSTLPQSKRRVRLSAHGPDGFAGARVAESGEWMIAHSISNPEPDVMPDPMLEPPEPPQPPVVPQAPAPQPQELGQRIDALVAAALERQLKPAEELAPVPPSDPAQNAELERTSKELELARIELAQARDEAARVREDADQARAEAQALSARLEQLEAGLQAPPLAPALEPPAPAPEPTRVESRLEDQLASVMRELEGPGV